MDEEEEATTPFGLSKRGWFEVNAVVADVATRSFDSISEPPYKRPRLERLPSARANRVKRRIELVENVQEHFERGCCIRGRPTPAVPAVVAP